MKNKIEHYLLQTAFQTSDDDCLSMTLFSFRKDTEDDDEDKDDDDDEVSPFLNNGNFFCVV